MSKKDEKIITFTLEEAKRIEDFLDEIVDLYNKDHIKIFSYGFETIYMVKNRIRETEKQCSSE